MGDAYRQLCAASEPGVGLSSPHVDDAAARPLRNIREAPMRTPPMRDKRPARTLEEEIAIRLKQATDSGELRAAESYGKPLRSEIGWDATPEAWRMPMKVLKDAGGVPAEVEMFRERARLKAAIATEHDTHERRRLQTKLAELEQNLALRLEAMRRHASR